MTAQPATQQARLILGQAGRVARRNFRRLVEESRGRAHGTHRVGASASDEPRLAPATALRENGFTVYRGLFPVAECARLSQALKTEAKIRQGVKFTKVDATNFFPTARQILFEGRIIDAVRSALGAQPRFLQVSDLHYLHDTAGWHRDSVHRARDDSQAPDWTDASGPYGVVKAILYLEADNAAMGIIPGSHLSPIEMDHGAVKSVEDAGGQLVVDLADEPNQRLTPAQKQLPMAWHAQVGDVLVFDERMYHAGRRVENGHVSANREAPKLTLSLVFGLDNKHSERLYSYFRFARKELYYRDLAPALVQELERRDLVLDRGWTNYYADHPDELSLVYLRDPAQLPMLIEEFAGAKASA
jgi:hypothetical protein